MSHTVVTEDAATGSPTAVDKLLKVLRELDANRTSPTGVSDLSRKTGLTKSTTFRLLRTLERNEMVRRVGRDYQFTGLSPAARPDTERRRRMDLTDLLTPYLTDLYAATQQTVHLAVLDASHVVYLNKLCGHRAVPSPSRIGGRAPAHCTSVGKALLAFDAEAAERVLASELRSFTPHTISSRPALEAALLDVRLHGLAFDDEEAAPGLSCVAAPVMGPSGRPVAAVSLAGFTARQPSRNQIDVLRRVARSAEVAVTQAFHQSSTGRQ